MADSEVELSPIGRDTVITYVRITTELPALVCLQGQLAYGTHFL
ncbi:rCG28088, isoform CRA_b, partial [Rattus norvegicus]